MYYIFAKKWIIKLLEKILVKITNIKCYDWTLLKKFIHIKFLSFLLLLSVIAWFLEATEGLFLMYSIGYSNINTLYLVSIYSLSLLIGVLSFLPGGIFSFDLTFEILLVNLLKIDITITTIIVFLTRLTTLYFGTIIGITATLLLLRIIYSSDSNEK